MMNTAQLFDHHMHSEFSADSTQDYEVLIQEAIAAGKQALVTTDHYEPINEDTGFFCLDIPAYYAKVEQMQAKYPQIRLIKGIEIGYEPCMHQRTVEMIASEQFELIILSIHSIQAGLDFGDTFKKQGYWPYDGDPVKEYFESMLALVRDVDGFQILGHVDVITRYFAAELFNFEQYRPILTEIFEQSIRKDIAIDLNTSGWRYGLNYPHPQPQILALYRELGGTRICLGSDAHQAIDVNADFDKAVTLLRELGFSAITSYETGQAQQIKI